MDNRNVLQNIAQDMIRMESISRSIKSGNQKSWVRGAVLIHNAEATQYQLASCANRADKIIAQLMKTR